MAGHGDPGREPFACLSKTLRGGSPDCSLICTENRRLPVIQYVPYINSWGR